MAAYEVQRVTTTTRSVKKQQQQQQYEVNLDSPWDLPVGSSATVGSHHGSTMSGHQRHASGLSVESLSQRLHNTRAARVRQALFPETMEGWDTATMTSHMASMDLGEGTAVQKLADPAQVLKTAVVNLLNYQEDADVALHASNELKRLLQDRDEVTVQRAATLLHLLTKKQACRLAFATQADLLEVLIQLVERTQHLEILRNCMACLAHISKSEQGSLSIFQSRSRLVPLLIKYLTHSEEQIVYYSITCLHNILLIVEEAKNEVRLCGGIQKMVSLLKTDQLRHYGDQQLKLKFLSLLVDCLQIVCFANSESKLLLLNAGGPEELVRILLSTDYEKLLFVTARLLKVLSVCPSNKPAIIEYGGMSALGRHLADDSTRLVINVLWTLRNLSDQSFLLTDLDDLLEQLIGLLNSHDADYITCAAGILCNLTCQNPHNKQVVTQKNGAVALTQTLCAAQDREEISEPVVCALRHLTHDHPLDESAGEAVRYHYGLPVLANLLLPEEQQRRRPLVKACLGLARNLALFDSCRQPLLELGIVSSAAEAIQLVPQTPRGSDADSDVIDGVRSDEIVEMGLACLQALCKDRVARQEVVSYQPPLVPLLVQALYSEVEYIQRNVTGLLTELTVDPRAAAAVESEGASARLTQLLHSRNDAVATYSAAILYHLAEDKPTEYKQRLQTELTHSLTRQDLPEHLHNGTHHDMGWDHSTMDSRYGNRDTGVAYMDGTQPPPYDSRSLDHRVAYQQVNGTYHGPGRHPSQPQQQYDIHPQGYNTYNGHINL